MPAKYPTVAPVAAARRAPRGGMFGYRPQSPSRKGSICEPHRILDAMGKLWGSTNSALGLLAAGGSYVAGKVAGTDPKFQIGNNAIQLLNSPLNIGNRAYTLGNVQVYGTGEGPEKSTYSYTGAKVNNGRHEEGHTLQSQFLGPTYLTAELWGSLLGNRNPLEVGADKYGLGQSCTGF
jgi:hypothetical protein